jgi:ubiquinone/menaquinone biosynthesis C-methylase UbiE
MALTAWLERLYWKLEQRIAPGLRSSQDAYKDALDRRVTAGMRWLDLGCGNAVLPAWHRAREQGLVARCSLVVGLDRYLPSLTKHATIAFRACGDISQLPFADASFDLVTANMVVEHLADPAAQVREIRRVLAPGGVFMCHTPNVFSYPTIVARLLPDAAKKPLARWLEGRRGADVFKTYYRANSPRRLRRVVEDSGLEHVEVAMILSSAVFALVTPLAVLELIWIRALMSPRLAAFRPTMIGTFTKAAGSR